MRAFARPLVDGLRATFLIRPRGNPLLVTAGVFVAMTLIYLLAQALSSWIEAPLPRAFIGYGVVTVFADTLLTLIAAWLLVRIARRDGIVWGVATMLLAATALTAVVVHGPLQLATQLLFAKGYVGLALVLAWLSRAWWLLVLIACARWLMPRALPRALLAAALAFAISAMPWWWLPGAPIFTQDAAALAAQQAAERAARADVADQSGERAEETVAFDAEAVLYDQPRLLEEAFTALKPRVAGRSNLYVLAFAGDGSENVFRNEVEYVERLFAERFGARGHILVLENNPASISTRPLATLTNLRVALAELAARMDPANDILFVYLTTHGSAEHLLYVNLAPLPLNQIGPEDLAEALQTTPSIRWKVLVVNACYAGGFIDALRDDSTLVIASARADRTSFGCGTESDITYFGKAFLAEALNQTTSIPEAFSLARTAVGMWEADDAVKEHSEPQIATSRSIEAKLERWRSQLDAGAPVPFTPAPTVDSANETGSMPPR